MLWLPVIGPILEGIVSIFNKKMDTDVQKLNINRVNDVEEAKTIYSFMETMKDDISLRLIRDLVLIGPAVWIFLLSYDTIIADSVFKDYMWHVATFEKTGAPYLPYAVTIFLLGNIGINAWKRR